MTPISMHARSPSGQAGQHALVLGGSLSGLMAARVLSDHFDRVTIVERDRYPAASQHRKGTPQARHAHGLLAGGLRAMERLFPGLGRELAEAGAIRGDIIGAFRWYHFGGYKAQFQSGLEGLLLSRLLLEETIRHRVLARPDVEVLEGYAASGLLGDAERDVVLGAQLRDGQPLHADLVVDATGRGSRAPAWLEALGFERPEEETIEVGVGYTSRLYRRRPGDLDGLNGAIVVSTPPAGTRMGSIIAQEGDRWMVMLGGWLGDHAPPTDDGYRAFAQSLPTRDVYDVIRDAEPVSDFATYRFPSNRRRRYERVGRPPEGFLVVGDAVCSFNPIYGQGMTAAALEAVALGRCLAARGSAGSLAGLPRRFFRRAARLIDTPWTMAAGADFAFPEVRGRRPAGTALANAYTRRLHWAAQRDPAVCRAFFEVANLLKPPAALFHPAIALRALRASGPSARWAEPELERVTTGAELR